MITRMPKSFQVAADLLRNVPLVGTILKPLYHRLGDAFGRNRFKALHSNGIKTLYEFDKAMNSNNLSYCVYAGTLLGAIREKGMLKHDKDIDTAVFSEIGFENVRNTLLSAGFSLVRFFEVENGKLGREETYSKNGVDIDVFYIYTDENGKTYNCDFHPHYGTRDLRESMKIKGSVGVRKCVLPLQKTTKRAVFEDIMVNIPINAEEWLIARYGKTYMIPDENFRDSGKEKHIFEWQGVKAVYQLL